MSTTVLPHARAGAIFHASISRGKFHGITWPMTPNYHRVCVCEGSKEDKGQLGPEAFVVGPKGKRGMG